MRTSNQQYGNFYQGKQTTQQKPYPQQQSQFPNKSQQQSKKSIRYGLQNIGNSCYMNSVLQLLFHLPRFTDFFHQTNPDLQQILDEKQDYSSLIVQYLIISNTTDVSYQELLSFKDRIDQKIPQFEGTQQQDAQEFLMALLQVMHEEINIGNSKRQYRELKDIDPYQDLKSQSKDWWEYFLRRDNSQITTLFSGQLINRISCIKCHNQSLSFDNFRDISLSFPENISSRTVMLQQLIDNFQQRESALNGYKCQKCKQEKCIKKLGFWKLPQILILHFKRFNNSLTNKVTNKIILPESLDLSQTIERNYRELNQSLTQQDLLQKKYVLCSYIDHHGSNLYKGHYTATVKNFDTQEWLEYDDEKCTKIQRNPIHSNGSEKVYLAVYIKL